MSEAIKAPHLDLDQVEREKSELKDPFTVNLNGRVVELTDPSDIDWKDLMEIENPIQFFKFCLSDEDKAFFKEQSIPGWKLGKMIEGYQKHFGLADQGKAAASLM